MMAGESAGWVAETRRRARLLQSQIARIEAGAHEKRVSDDLLERMLEPYRTLLESAYTDDLPLARLLDESDLLVHVKGQAADAPAPKLTLLTKLMGEFRDAVGDVARLVAHLDVHRLPGELELSFAGLARGSLFLGFRVQPAAAGDVSSSALTRVAEAAIERILSTAPAVASEDATALRAIDDPAERDAVISVVHKLSPSGKIGVRELALYGRGGACPVALTVETRRAARSILSKPLEKLPDSIELVGTVREVDVDQQRFELRNVEGRPDVRCAFDFDVEEARWLIDRRVRVKGRPEYDRRFKGHVRLLWVEEYEPLGDYVAP
jgi:hypothetical protein